MKINKEPNKMDLKRLTQILQNKQNAPRVNVDSVLKANMSKNFIQRMFESNPASIPSPYEKGQSMTHFMEVSDAMAYPRVVKTDKGLKLLSSDEAYDYAKKNGEFIKFNNDDDAVYFTKNYKKGKNVTIGKPKK